MKKGELAHIAKDQNWFFRGYYTKINIPNCATVVCGIFLITRLLLSGSIGDAVMTSLINICIWGLIVAD